MPQGVLWQVDRSESGLSPIEQVRRALAAVAARHGCTPQVVQVCPAAAEWPEEIDGARVVPTPRMSYPTLMLVGWGDGA